MAAPRMHVSVGMHAVDRFLEHFSPGLDRAVAMDLIRDAAERGRFFENQEAPRQIWRSCLADGQEVVLIMAVTRSSRTVVTVMPGDAWDINRQASRSRDQGVISRCFKPTNRSRRILMNRKHREKSARRAAHRRTRDDAWR